MLSSSCRVQLQFGRLELTAKSGVSSRIEFLLAPEIHREDIPRIRPENFVVFRLSSLITSTP